ncbi:MAG: LysR substrate-binding domain-containing protein, partial [Burkholderiales bacterium]
AVSRQVAELERNLQTRLLQRTTRRISLTEAGRLFHARCVQILADLGDAEQEVGREAAEPRGTIRLTTSINFGTHQVTPAIASFLARHPHVKFDVSLSDRIVDIVEEGFDLAIRIGGTGAQNLVARKLGETRLLACAAPGYIAKHGAPAAPEDLVRHNCLTYEYALRDTWTFRDAAGRERTVRVAGRLNSNNGELNAAAAAQGLGIALEPDFIVGTELKNGTLVRVLESFEAPALPIYAIYPSRRFLPAKVRAFVDFLAERCASVKGGA